jgi:hypothetical protein
MGGVARVEQDLARVYVDDLDVALPLYERLAGGAPVRRFGFRAVGLADPGSAGSEVPGARWLSEGYPHSRESNRQRGRRCGYLGVIVP